MLELRPYEHIDGEKILSWIQNERQFRLWTADRYDHYPITAEDMDRYYAACAEHGPFWAMTACDEAGPEGHLILRFPEGDRKHLRLGFIIVDASRRGRGYGKALLGLAIGWARQFPEVERITLGVFEDNQPARHCYRAAGFRENGAVYEVRLMGETWNCLEMEYRMK